MLNYYGNMYAYEAAKRGNMEVETIKGQGNSPPLDPTIGGRNLDVKSGPAKPIAGRTQFSFGSKGEALTLSKCRTQSP
jgi:hypothetical protein